MENEIWKPIPNTKEYFVSTNGNIKTNQYDKHGIKIRERKIVGTLNNDGYRQTRIKILNRNNKKVFKFHRVVAEVFIPNPNPEKFFNVLHRDGDSDNNHVNNLFWGTISEATDIAIRNGNRLAGLGQKLSINDVREIRMKYDTIDNMTMNDLSVKYGVTKPTILAVLIYRTFKKVDPDDKTLYRINQVDNSGFIEMKRNFEKEQLIKIKNKAIDINPILNDYYYQNLNVNVIAKKYKSVTQNKVKLIIKTNKPLPIISFPDEEWVAINDYYSISNYGRTINLKENRIVKSYATYKYKDNSTTLNKLVGILFIPNPNELPTIKIDPNIHSNKLVEKLMWVKSCKLDIPIELKEKLIYEYKTTNQSVGNLYNKIDKTLYLKKDVYELLKPIEKTYTTPKLCKICGEDNPNNFYQSAKSKCIKCFKVDYAINRQSKDYSPDYLKNKLIVARVSAAKTRAERFLIDFDISVEYVYELLESQNNKCAYSGVELKFEVNDNYTVSIDRIDSNKGYTKSNTQLVAKTINVMKSNLNEKDFLDIIYKIWETKNLGKNFEKF